MRWDISTIFRFNLSNTLGVLFNDFSFVECSNRGVCEYETGLCQCFKGFWGSACEILKDIPGSEEEE